jgi:hypothetical protein
MFRRFFSAAILTALSAVGLRATASTPESQTVTVPTTPGGTVVIEWTGVSPAGTVAGATNSCDNGAGPLEDHHEIELTVPAGAYDSVKVAAQFHIDWDGATGSDLVLSVLRDGATIDSSDGGTPQENVSVINPAAGTFDAIACSFKAAADTPYRGKLTLTAASSFTSPPAGTGNATGLPPRLQLYKPDYGTQGFGMFGGEASVDVNWNTGSIFYLGFLETLRLRLDESTSPAAETWELKTGPASSQNTLDPILVGDPGTGRIFAMQLSGGQSAMDYTDTDGESWQSAMAGGIGSGVDHQSMGVGPYPAGTLIPHPSYDNAVYYCSQDVAVVFCSRSDDGGATFGNSIPIYSLDDCQGLHGHVKVAPDGTVYVPVAGCPSPLVDSANSQPAVVVSTNAGLTWAVHKVTTSALGSGGHGSDPSIATATDNTLYMAYIDAATNHMHMARSLDQGASWERDVDIGAMTGIHFAQFPAAVAGDPDRAAVAFFGSTFDQPGAVDTATTFDGTWQLYLAVTYDGGQTYHVVDVTAGDPIQRGGICGSGFCRNLLDFFDAAMDPEGRIVIGYEDGCVGGCPLGSHGTFSDQVAVARQSGGRHLLASKDPVEPALPGAPLLSGFRTADFVQLEWPDVDNGGSPLVNYNVYRGTSAAAPTLLANVGKKRQYIDVTADPGTTYFYSVAAVNGVGAGAKGNELELAVGDNVPAFTDACALPGFQIAVDRTGEPEASPLSRDIARVYVAEPEDMAGKLVFTLKFAQAAPPNQGGPTVRVFFDLPNGGKHMRLQMSAQGAGTYGHIDKDPNGVHNFYINEGSLDAATYQTDGTLRLVIAKSKLGVETGATLLGIYATTWPSAASANVTTEEAGYVDYTLRGNDFCATGGVIPPPPVPPPAPAQLEGNTHVGGALPPGALVLLGMIALLARRRSR